MQPVQADSWMNDSNESVLLFSEFNKYSETSVVRVLNYSILFYNKELVLFVN